MLSFTRLRTRRPDTSYSFSDTEPSRGRLNFRSVAGLKGLGTGPEKCTTLGSRSSDREWLRHRQIDGNDDGSPRPDHWFRYSEVPGTAPSCQICGVEVEHDLLASAFRTDTDQRVGRDPGHRRGMGANLMARSLCR